MCPKFIAILRISKSHPKPILSYIIYLSINLFIYLSIYIYLFIYLLIHVYPIGDCFIFAFFSWRQVHQLGEASPGPARYNVPGALAKLLGTQPMSARNRCRFNGWVAGIFWFTGKPHMGCFLTENPIKLCFEHPFSVRKSHLV